MMNNQYNVEVSYAPIPTRNPELPDDRPDYAVIRFYGRNLTQYIAQDNAHHTRIPAVMEQ